MKNIEQAKKIRLLILDADGVLTAGQLIYGDKEELKIFHIHDGLGIKLLQKAGIAVAIISGKTSSALVKRVADLSIEHAYFQQEDKLPAYEALKEKLQLTDDAIAYMGDDLPDLPLLRRAGLAMTVPNAVLLVKQHVHLITEKNGGEGAVREVCEILLKAQGLWDSVIKSYLNH